ncbi:uncharacterized protein LOC118186331 [Stegodyphus dumicola]|uniref:uncharacterized protein LOC118186331 n=1 Tax=Stegodyphus dumicola TaxID=202533 RepID=UPI0015AFCC55|nr:uncharacterized protein LOC118186331 [Stegodyphus dumicola]XP_035212306.1 uncharacterized protein LOC118186331 [Stegodyphus dumicola]
MEAYLPSEVARLVLGYLEEVKCTNTWETFLVESPHLQEYYQLHQQGIKYAANINGKSLLGILQEYRCLIGSSSKQSGTQCSCNKTSNPLNSENFATPNKNNRNKFTKFQVNQKIQTQSVIASLKYGQSNVSSSRRLFNASETPHRVNICKTPKRQMGLHVTALNFGPEAVQINDAKNCKYTTDKVNVHLHGNNLQSSPGDSVPTVSGSCVSEPDLRICHRTVQTEPLSNSLVDLNAGNHSLQSEQPSASDTVKLNNSKNIADRLPVQSGVTNTGSSICNIIESSPTCSATESCEELGSSSEPAGPFSTDQLNLESSTKIVSTEDQISIIKQSLVCTSSEVTTCSENVVVTATVENSSTPQYIAEPPMYNRAPSTNSPRLILSYDRSQIASLTTPMKEKKSLEEFYSPKRKGFIPRRRLLSESPLPKLVQGNDRTSLAIHEDWFLDFNGTDTLAQIIAENINKEVKSNEELVKDSDGSNSSTYPSLQDINGSVDVIKNVIARTEADPVVDDFLSYLCNSRDSFEVNLTQESAANSAQNNTFKGDADVTKDNNCIPGSAENKKSDKQAAVNPSSVENAVNYVSSITNEEGDKLSELSSSAEKSTLPDNNSFCNLPSTQNNDEIENTDVSIQNTDVPVQNTDAINCAENTDKLPNNIADSVLDSAHNGDDDDDNDSVIELAVISPQKQDISKSIDAPAKISSAPGLSTKEVNTQNEDSKVQSVDIADSCYNILNEHKSKCPQCHSEELVTNIVTVNTTDNDSWKALQESCPNCHYQQLGKNNENNSSVQMSLSSSKQIINTEARTLTAVPTDSNDIHLYGNHADKNKFLVDNFQDKQQMVTGMNINQMFSNSVAPSAVENVSSQATMCSKAVNNIVSNVGNIPNTLQEISTSVPSVQTVTLGVPCQNVNNSVPASSVLQWPYSTVPTIFVSNNLPNVLPSILPNSNACQYQIIFKPDSNQTSCNASNVILPLQPISSVNQVPNTYLPLPKDMGASNVVVSSKDRSKPEYRTVRKLVFIPSSTKPSETNKRKQEGEDEPAPKKRAYNVQGKKSSKPVKQCRKYNKRRKSRSLFPSDSSDSPNKNRTQKSKITEIGDEIPVISIPEPSPSKSDLRSAFEIFSEITEVTEKQSPVLQTLISSAKLLSGEGGRLNATHVRTLDFSPKKNKEKGGSQVKTSWQKKFDKEFPNRRASSRIKKLRGISVESKNLDIADDNRGFENNAFEDEENTEKENAYNDNCSVSSQHVTNEIIDKTIQEVCTNKTGASEMANVVLKAMEEAITIKSSNNTLSTISEMSCNADISETVQTDNLCASMPEVLIDAEDGMCNTKLSPVLTNASKSPVASKNKNAVKTTPSESVPSAEHGLSTKNKKCSYNNSDLVANPPAVEEVFDNKKSSGHDSNLTANSLLEKEPENTTILLNAPSDEKRFHRNEYFPESDSSSSSDLPDVDEYFFSTPKQDDPQIKSHITKSIPVQGQTDQFISVSKKEHFDSNLQKSKMCPSILKTSETSRKGKRNAAISPPKKSNSLCKDEKELKKLASSGQVLTDEERLLRYTTQDNKHCSNISKFNSLKDKHLIDKNMNILAEEARQVVEQIFSKSPASEASNVQSESVSRKHKPSVNKNKKISNKSPSQKSNQTFSYSNTNINPNDVHINKTNLTLHKEKKKTSDATTTKCLKKLQNKLIDSGTNNKHNEKPYQGGKQVVSDATSSKCLKKLEKKIAASGVDDKLSSKLHHREKQTISDVASSKYLEKQENDLTVSEVNDSDKPHHSEKQASSPSFHGRISLEINDSNSTMNCKGRNVNISTSKSANNSSEVPSSVKDHTKLTSGNVTLQPVFESVLDHNKSVDCPEKSSMEIVSENHQNERKESLSQTLTDKKSQESKTLNTELNGNEPVNSEYLNPKGDDAATKVLSNQVPPNPKISKAADLSTSYYSQSVSENSGDLNEISASVSSNQNSHGLTEIPKSSEISNLSDNLNSSPQHDKIIDQNSEIMNSQVQTSKVGHIKSPRNVNLETIASAQSSSISPPQTNIIPPLKKRIKPVQIGSPSHRSCFPGSPFMPEEHTVCIDSSSNLSLRKDTCSNAGISTSDAVNIHALSENADFKYKNFTPPKQKFSFQKPLSGKPKAMTEFYRNAIPERSTSVPISPGSISSSSCTLDSFLAKRQLELLSSVNANDSQAKEIENVLNSESFNGKQKLVGSLNTSSTLSSLSDTFMSPNKTDADTLLTPPQRRKRKRPVKMLSSPEPTPEKLPLKPENQESQHLIEDSFVNIKSLHSSPVKCTSAARNLATKSIFHKKMEQNPNMPAGVKMPPKWNISKISSYTNDIFNSHSSSNEKKKNEKESFKIDGKIRRSRPSLKVKPASKAQSVVKQKCASEKNLTKSEILCDKSILDSDKNSEKSDMQECKKRCVSRTNSISSSKSKISDKVQSRKSDSPTNNKSPKKYKILNNAQKGKLAKSTKTSETADVFVYKEPDFSFQNFNSKTYNRKEYQSVSKNVCAEQVNQHVIDPEKMQVPSVSENAHEVLAQAQAHEAPTERSSEDENELAQAIAFITSNPADNESMLIDDQDKDAENRLDTAIQEPCSVSPLKQKFLCGDVPEPERNEAEKMNANSLRNVETEEMAVCTEQSECVNSAVTEETAVGTEQAESVNNVESEETLDEQAKMDQLMRVIKEYGVENLLNRLRRKP